MRLFEQKKPASKAHVPGRYATLPSASPQTASALPFSLLDILHLQRTVGNHAVLSLLGSRPTIQRYQVEGPWDKGDPVHEVLTLVAIKDAVTQLQSEGAKPGPLLAGVKTDKFPTRDSKSGHNISPEKTDRSVHQFIRGVVFPDDPKGWLFDKDGDATDYSSGAKWYGEFRRGKKESKRAQPNIPADLLIARSHFGDLQFFHGMASGDAEPPEQTRKKILRWSRFLTEVASGGIDPNSKVGQIDLIKEWFTAYAEITLKKLFGYEKATDDEIRQRAAGALLHLIQDSNAAGHVERDRESGAIRQFHAYGSQDEHKHGQQDAWAKGKNLGERIKNTPGVARALAQCTKVLIMLDKGAGADAVVQYLDEQVFKLDNQVELAGPGGEFAEPKQVSSRTRWAKSPK